MLAGQGLWNQQQGGSCCPVDPASCSWRVVGVIVVVVVCW